MKSICSGWEFTSSPTEDFLSGKDNGAGYAVVRLPHTVAETPLHYASPEQYTGVFGYRKSISIEDIDKRYFVRFDGAAHAAELFVNGRPAGEHYCGYTAFKAEITEFVHEGENVIAVRLDTNERKDVPPFGFVMDYLGYGGLYREAWLETEERVFIEDIFGYGDEKGLLRGSLTLSGEYAKALCRVTVGETSIFEFECARW